MRAARVRRWWVVALAALACLLGGTRAGADDAPPPPTVGFAATTAEVAAPGYGQTSTVTLNVTLSNPDSSGAMVVDWQTADASQNGSLTFQNDGTDGSQAISITIGGDTAQSISVSLAIDGSSTGDATIDPSAGTATITLDALPPPVVSVGGVPPVTPGGTDVSVNLPVTLSRPSSSDATVSYSAVDGTAANGADYALAGGTLTIQSGQTSASIPVTIKAGTPGGDFTVALANPGNATIGNASVLVTIRPTLSVLDTTLDGVSTTTAENIPIALSAPLHSNVTLAVHASDGTATSPADYSLNTPVVTIPAGASAISIPITVEGGSAGGQFTLALSNSAGLVVVAQPSVVVTIGAGGGSGGTKPTISIADAAFAAAAADTQVSLPVTLSAAAAADVTVHYAAADGTATSGTDYVLGGTGTLTIPAGQTTASIPITIKAGTKGGTFSVTLSSPSSNALLASGHTSATVTVVTGAALSIADQTVKENDPSGQVTLTVTLLDPPATPVTVAYATHDGTATAGTNYTAASGTLTFPAGGGSGTSLVQTVVVPILDDPAKTGSETFTVTLSNPQGAALARATATVTVLDAAKVTPPVTIGSGSVGFGTQNTSGLHQSGGSKKSGSSSSGGSSSGGSSGSSASAGSIAKAATTAAGAKALRVRIVPLSLRLSKQHTIRVRLACPKATHGCVGKLTVLAKAAAAKKQAKANTKTKPTWRTLGVKKLTLKSGRTVAVLVKLNPYAISRLRKAKHLQANVVVAIGHGTSFARSIRSVVLRYGPAPISNATLTIP